MEQQVVFLGSYRVIYPQPKEQQDVRQHKKTKSEEKSLQNEVSLGSGNQPEQHRAYLIITV